ncbi:hypothetical protein V6Z11_D03G094800 [Gossypium hirsutum]
MREVVEMVTIEMTTGITESMITKVKAIECQG